MAYCNLKKIAITVVFLKKNMLLSVGNDNFLCIPVVNEPVFEIKTDDTFFETANLLELA